MAELQQKHVPAQKVVGMVHDGSYAEIGDVYRQLKQWVKDHNVATTGHGMTIFYTPDTPFDPASARFEVCLPIKGKVPAESGVTVKTMPETTVMYMVHKGPYSDIPAHYTEILAWIDAEGYEIVGPPREVYIKRPAKPGKDSAACVTEIQLPVSV